MTSTTGASSRTLHYAKPTTPRPRSTRHSPLAGWAWGMMVMEVVYKGAVVAYAYHRSPTWPWARFQRNVGNPEFFIRIDRVILYVGLALAMAALLHPHRKRWAAWAAFAVFLWLVGSEWVVINRA
jgi:hypothetical protein